MSSNASSSIGSSVGSSGVSSIGSSMGYSPSVVSAPIKLIIKTKRNANEIIPKIEHRVIFAALFISFNDLNFVSIFSIL